MYVKRFVCWVITLLVIASCDPSEESRFRRSDEIYFPLQTGQYRIYYVEEIRYALSVPETISYDLKVVVTDSFTNDEAGTTFVLHRFRSSDGGTWLPDATWSARRLQNEVIISEGNVPYVVLNFPLEKGRKWNGNAYNSQLMFYTDEPDDEYELISTDETLAFDGHSFTRCLAVEQENEEDPILYKDFRLELYAPDVGLIGKETIQLKYCSAEGRGCIGEQIVDEGFIYKQRIIGYGRE